MMMIGLLLLVSLSIAQIEAQVGPFPAVGPHQRQPRVASSKKFTPTNVWWSNWNLNQGANQIQTYPYIVRTSTQGFHMCYGGQILTSSRNVQTAVNDNLVLSVREAFGQAIIDASTVNQDQFDLAAKVNFGSSFDVTVVRGSASIVANIKTATPVLKTIHAITGSSTPGIRSFKISLNNGQTWLIQSQFPINWQVSGTELVSPSAYLGWIKISIVPSAGAEQLLIQTLDSVMTNGKVTYSVNRAQKKVSVSVTYNADSVYFILPHMTNAYGSVSNGAGEGHGIKGIYKTSRGTGYTYDLPIFEGSDPKKAVDSAEKRDKLSAALREDVSTLRIDARDPYFGGKAMAKAANLVDIADLLGDETSKTRARDVFLREIDNFWFVSNNPQLVFEPTWGGLVSRSSVGDAGADFGNYYYNDHHFHYGYFIYVAAILAKYYPQMYEARRNWFEPILADYAGTCQFDNMPCFPRNKDSFLGFSYAGGLNEFADSKDQESTSESVNSYVSVRKLARALGDRKLEDLADYLLSSEIVSCQTYWHIRKGSNIYSSPFADNGVVGILWETKADYATWFGINTEFIWAIQILPVSEISTDLLTSDWLRETRSVWRSALDAILPSQGKFADYLLLADAIVDPNRPGLSTEIHRLTIFDDGNCRTNELYFYYMIGGTPSDVEPIGGTTTTQPNPIITGDNTDYGRPDPACNTAAGELGCHNAQNQLTGCYFPSDKTCFADGHICPKPLLSCGPACYDPAQYACNNGNLVFIGRI